MNWYLAKIVYRIICGSGDHTPQFEEQLRLILADNRENAFLKAHCIGKKEEDSFLNVNQELVQWQFVNISELYSIKDLNDGSEIHCRIEEKENADIYIEVVNKRAEAILQSSSPGFENHTLEDRYTVRNHQKRAGSFRLSRVDNS